MRLFENQDGTAFTASSDASVAQFEDVVTANFGLRADLGGKLKTLMESDPDMIMANCTSGYFAKSFGGTRMAGRAQKASGRVDQLIEQHGATDQEKLHAAALRNWCAGDLEKTASAWEDIMLDNPLDGLAIRLSHFAHFYSGDGRRMRDSIARVLPSFDKSHRNYGYVLGCYAFGLEESRQYAEAEKFGRAATDINPEDAWSVHSVAHVLEMQGRHAEGVDWVGGLEDHWSKVGNFRFHLYWHRSLYHFERGEFDIALDLYDRQVSSDVESGFYLDIVNAASLLWRLEMADVDVGNRWEGLADIARDHLEDTDLIFVTLHYLMVMASVGDLEAQTRMLAHVREWSAGTSTQSAVCRVAGLAIAEAITEIRRGDFTSAARRIAAIRYDMDKIGGSAAQRDVFQMLMLDASAKGEETTFSRSLLTDRVAAKPDSAWGWKKLSTVCRNSGESDRATEAEKMATALQL